MSDAGISHQCSRGGAAGPDCGMYGGMSPVHVYRSTDIHFYCSPGWLVGSEKPAVMGGGCVCLPGCTPVAGRRVLCHGRSGGSSLLSVVGVGLGVGGSVVCVQLVRQWATVVVLS